MLLIHQNVCSQSIFSKSEKYIIAKSSHNGINMTKFDTERGGKLIFELDQQNPIKLINYSSVDKTSSFGLVYDFFSDTIKSNDSKFIEVKSIFKWKFKNDYDNASGIAEVLFNQKQTNYGIDFYLKIVIPKKNEKIEYRGYKEGTRSEFVLSETVFQD